MANRSSTSTSRDNHAQADEHANEPMPEAIKDEKSSPTSREHTTISLDTQEDLEQRRAIVYLHGWRLHVLTLALCLSLFLSTMETTIVSTALVAITNALNGFEKSNWIVASYLLTYSGFLIILSRFSDIFGRKPLMLLVVFLFTVFSAACGAAQTFTQLVILRAFQGIGGGGIYTLVFVVSGQMVPKERYAALSGILSSAYAFSATLGPVLGGLISGHTTWRWVFLLNVPPGFIALVMIFLAMPVGFPYRSEKSAKILQSFTMAGVQSIDFLGAFLVLAASILSVSALEEGGTEYPWKSSVVLSLLCLSVILWVLFFLWQKVLSGRADAREPILPWRLLTDRFTMGFLLNALFGGAIFIPAVVLIPQRFQVVNDLFAFNAGWRLLALMLCSPLGSVTSGYLVQKIKVPPLYIFLVAAILQTVGLALMGTLNVSNPNVPSAQYGYQVILGLGIGLTLSSLLIAAPTVITEKDTAVFVGALTQARILGGSIGLAACTNILNDKVKSESEHFLSPQQLNGVLASAETINTLSPDLQRVIRRIFASGYNEEMQVLTGFGGACLLASLLMWEKKPRRME